MDIAKIVRSKIINLEKMKKIIFYLVTAILLSLLLLLFLYNNSYYGLLPLILFTGLIMVIVSAISLTLEYFHIVKEIRYNELLLQNLIEEYP